jgi:hypothetical protein
MNNKNIIILRHILKAKTSLQPMHMTDLEGVPVPVQEDTKVQPKLNYDANEPQDQQAILGFFAAFVRAFGAGAAKEIECIRKVIESKSGRDFVRQLVKATEALIEAKNSGKTRSISAAIAAMESLFQPREIGSVIDLFPCLKEYGSDPEFRRKLIRALGDRLQAQDKAFIEAVGQALGDNIAYDPDGLGLLVAVYKRLNALDSTNAEYAGIYITATILLEAREKEFFEDLNALLNTAQAIFAIGALIVGFGTGIGGIVAAIVGAVRTAKSLGELLQWLAKNGYIPVG